jgi:NitT/TauT family transport system permease protein
MTGTALVTTRSQALARIRRGRWPERIAGYVFFLGIWHIAAEYLVKDFILPTPFDVAGEMWDILASGQVWPNVADTYVVILRSFAVGLILGTAIGIAMGLSRWWDGFFRDALLTIFTTPGLIVVLMCLIVFGLSAIGPLVAIVIMTIPYVGLNVVEGVQAIDKDILDMARSFRMPLWKRLRHVVIPAVLPYLFQGMRFGFAISWKIAMLTEVFGGTSGIGYNIRVANITFDMEALLAWVFWFVLSALILERLVLQRLVDHSFRWRPEVAT